MTYLLPLIVALHASLGVAEDASLGNFHAPGRAERMFHKRAPVDHGTFKVDCKGSESACNNACYYIRCQARNVANPDRIVYIGPNGNNGEDSRNRVNSGCNFNNPSSGSVCANFPFSQKFIPDPTIGPNDNWQCDEWPPALAQQDLFGAPNRVANSLRCMPGAENGSLGGKLGNFIRSKAMNRDDFFRVDFQSNIGTADQSKVSFCLNPVRCGNDGYQFGMTEKPIGGGKISAPYNVDGDDNHYALQNTVYKDLFQCGVKFTRDGDKDIKDVELTNWENKDITGGTTSCTLNNNGDKCTLKGLANDLDVKRTGAFGSKLEFEYAPGLPNVEINNFKWNSETSGNGRGPWTDPASDPNRKPLRFCKVVDGSTANTQVVECWFPCYRNSDGQ